MFGKSLSVVLFMLCLYCEGKRRWDYEPISTDTYTADSEKLGIYGRIQRMPRGEFAYEGYLNYAYDVDSTTMVEGKTYHSQSGNADDYKPMAFHIPNQNYTEFIENFYTDMIYKNLGSCSNLPTVENAIPWKRGNYTFKDCVVNGDGLPEILPQGYYKITFSITGEVEWGFEAISKITDKYLP